LFPSNGTYQVRTLVNGSSLEECSFIRANDKIRPYFAVSVINDPDLIGLLVYIQDPSGKVIGDKVQYTLLPYADENALTEADLEKEAAETNEAEPGETAKIGEEDESSDEASEDETDDPAAQADGDEHQILERWSFTDTKPLEKKTDVEIAVKSLAKDLPYFPLPKELEIGPYVLVFEAVGKKDTLSRTETNVYYLGSAEFNLKDISMYLPGLSGPQLISPGTVIMLEASLDFDKRLDPYVIWYNGKNIINEGKISDGAGKLLWEAPEQAGFYSLRLEAFPFHLKRTIYTGLSREIALPVSPKAISLGHFFEDNKGYTARSPLSAGTAYAEQIKLLAAMALEEKIPAGTPRESAPPISYPAPELLQWYQFDGGLRDSLSTLTDDQLLLPVKESRPRWAAAGQSYGLAIGPDDPYLLAPINFFREEKDQGGGIVLFHIRPLSQGSIFSAFFPLESSAAEGVWIDMVKEGNIITLRLNTTDAFVELPLYFNVSAAEGLIPIAVEFYIRPYRLEAKISLDAYLQNRVGEIKLPLALSGEGRIRLGGVVDKSILDKSTLDKPTLDKSVSDKSKSEPVVDEEINTSIFSDTIWDELAILFSAVPLLPEEAPETDDEEDAAVYAANVQYEADAGTRPADTKPAETTISTDTKSADIDTDADISIQEMETQEPETQERATLTVLSDNP